MEDLTKQIDESEEEMQILLEDLELEKESRKGDKEKFEFDLAQFQVRIPSLVFSWSYSFILSFC